MLKLIKIRELVEEAGDDAKMEYMLLVIKLTAMKVEIEEI